VYLESAVSQIFLYLETAVRSEDMCVPGTGGNGIRYVMYPETGGNGIRYVVYLEPAVTVLDMLCTWNQR
jgi:hypothetical protein